MTRLDASTAAQQAARAFTLLPWEALSVDALYALLKLRVEVFVVEQQCAFQDLDGYDRVALHLLHRRPDGEVTAYARLLPPGAKYAEASIGRVVTAPACRRTGLGRQLMAEALRLCQTQYPGPIRIGAQLRLEQFYESFGFRRSGETYLEDGIWHIEMLREP